MSAPIEDELYARSLGWEVLRYLRQNEHDPQRIGQDAEYSPVRMLEQIRQILDDNTIEDPECLEKIRQMLNELDLYWSITLHGLQE